MKSYDCRVQKTIDALQVPEKGEKAIN